MITVRISRSGDPALLAPLLREADRQELLAGTGEEPLEALTNGLELSVSCMTALIDGEIVGMFGIVPNEEVWASTGVTYGVVWFLGSDRATESPKDFMRVSRMWLNTFKEDYFALGNLVDARNTVHIRWLKAMGFEFTNVHNNYGFKSKTFLEFILHCSEVSYV